MLPAVLPVITGEAAATLAGSRTSTSRSRAPVRVGCTRNESPACAVPLAAVRLTPSKLIGKVVKLPIGVLSESRVTV
ncbi:hypothetical protein D9M68_553470 [compost metagenome]